MNTTSISEMTELVVPLDGREASVRSVPVAGRLAGRLGLDIRLFGVADEPGEMESRLRGVADEYLPGKDAPVGVQSGDVVDAIVANAGDSAFVCMATAASLLPHQHHVGSVAEGVVRNLGRPVALVGPQMQPHPGQSTQRVIVPVDGSTFTEKAVGVGADLAKAMGVPLWIVNVIAAGDEAKANLSMGADILESGYVHSLAADTSRAYDIEVEYDVLHGARPAVAIVEFTGDDGTIVMCTHGRSGLSRMFGGSVAMGVVARSPRAVVVWRPDEV